MRTPRKTKLLRDGKRAIESELDAYVGGFINDADLVQLKKNICGIASAEVERAGLRAQRRHVTQTTKKGKR